MREKDKINLIKKRFFEPRNNILLIVFTILIVIMFASITMLVFAFNHKSRLYEKHIDFRTLYVDTGIKNDKQYELIKNINHVEKVTSVIYFLDYTSHIPEFDTASQKGLITIKPLILGNEIKVIKGKKPTNNKEMVCPEEFYPYSIYASAQSMEYNIDYSLYKKGSDYIGKAFPIEVDKRSSSGKKYEDFTLVGTYKKEPFIEANTCYITLSGIDKIAPEKQIGNAYLDEEGNIIETEGEEYTAVVAIVDNYKNLKTVQNELLKLNLVGEITNYYDESWTLSIKATSLLSFPIVIIICINILYSFTIKKCNLRKKNYGILKSLGYTNKDIKSLERNENIILIIISYILAFSIYFIGYHLVYKCILYEFVYANYSIQIPMLSMVLSFIIFIILITIFTSHKINKLLKGEVKDLLK